MGIRKVGVAGCGRMGGEAAQVCAQSGPRVVREVLVEAVAKRLGLPRSKHLFHHYLHVRHRQEHAGRAWIGSLCCHSSSAYKSSMNSRVGNQSRHLS
jgi:hypothetical protein